MTFLDTLKSVKGLTHYYPLEKDARDAVGTQHGSANGVTFKDGKAVFSGTASINLGDNNDFSVATTGGLSIVAFLAITDWRGKGAREYVHWAGKGKAGSHEWTFRHYVKGGSGEAGSRQGRCSFYHFNPSGGLGAGSYYQDGSFPTGERVFVATCDTRNISLAVNGQVRDTDPLSGYKIVPKNTGSSVFLGTRGDNTGFLVGTLRRVAFYNRVLTATEIKKLYDARNETSGGGSTPQPSEPEPTPTNEYLAEGGNLLDKHNALARELRRRGVI